MGRKQPDITRTLMLSATAVALTFCLLVSAGVTWARYRFRETTEVSFKQQTASQVYLWGGSKADGSFAPMPADLTAATEGKTLSFLLSNGQSGNDYSPHTQQAQVRLLCSLGLGNSANLSAELTVDGITYTAAAEKIDTQSPLYASFGEGWMYCFLDENGQELRWELVGNQLSTIPMQLKISAQPGESPSVLLLTASAEG